MKTIIKHHLLLAVLACAGLVACAGQPMRTDETAQPVLQWQATDDQQDSATAVAQSEQIAPQPSIASQPSTEVPAKYTDLWDRIRAGFEFPELRNQYVTYYEQWYQDRPEYLERMVMRARRYLHYIVEQVERRNMPMEIALLPAIESAFKPNAYSRAHAAGLWQFIPATGRRYGLKQNWWYDGRRNVVTATRAALDYLEFLHAEFNGDWFLALAAYNAGERRVQRAILYNQKHRRPTNYSSLSLKSETRRYVPKLIAFKNIVIDPEKFGIKLPPIAVEPYFARVETGGQIDLAILAKAAQIEIDELFQLNPAFRRWATDPDGPHFLLVPHASQQQVAEAINDLPKSARMQWANYSIKQGDTLGKIASRYRVSVAALQRANRLASSRIRAGHTLIIPVSAGPVQSQLLAQGGPPQRLAENSRNGSVPVVHHVRSGDTLWAIAKRYNVYINQLTHWNSIRSNDVLKLGQRLLIYKH